MDRLRIQGGRRLSGRVRVAGAKNAALPILATALLTEEPVVVRNVPRLRDIDTMLTLLQTLGVSYEWAGEQDLRLQTQETGPTVAPYELVRTMRASVLVLGPLLAARGKARVSRPGGCAIGARPVNLHAKALRELGAEIDTQSGFLEGRADRLRGAHIFFERVTVTGTENAMMAASLASGVTILENAAREPEVIDLAECLIKMGARIEGAGTSRIEIEGRDRLGGADHRVVPDRIEAGTWLLAGPMTGGAVTVEGCNPGHLESVLVALEAAGVQVERGEDSLHAQAGAKLVPHDVTTREYPGFPTDMQAQYMALMTGADGTSVITETIFENRFQHVSELARMGASIQLDGFHATVHGPAKLQGTEVMATDLRASASLLLAGLAAEGETVLHRIYHLDRGYSDIVGKVQALGGEIERFNPGPHQ